MRRQLAIWRNAILSKRCTWQNRSDTIAQKNITGKFEKKEKCNALHDTKFFMASIYDIWFDHLIGVSVVGKLRLANKYKDCAALYTCAELLGMDKDLEESKKQLKYMNQNDIGAVTYFDENYPLLLRQISNPPWMLYYRGDSELWNTPSVAIVGARKASNYGKMISLQLAQRMASCNVTVISGMAYGVDTFAHKGALEHGGKTIAVLGCGVDICYPAVNKELMEQIVRNGLVVSEFFPGTSPRPFRFPLRNRIISGLSRGVIVTEAGLSSGSLITAEFAGEQGRDIFSVPGNITQINSIGTNKLIQDGAIPVVTVMDVEKELGFTAAEVESLSAQSLGIEEKQLCKVLSIEGETTVDILCKKLNKSPAQVNGIVTILEMKGLVQTSFGKIYIANS